MSTSACPLCGAALNAGGHGSGAPGELGGWKLWHCARCQHSCCPGAYSTAVDYQAVYGADYFAQQIAPLRDPRKRAELALLPPYLRFHQLMGPGRGRTLLDVGAGAGRFLHTALESGWQARGIEPALAAVEAGQAAGLPLSNEGTAHLRQMGQQFDLLTLFDVLEHVADPPALLRDCLPLLRPGGLLFITVPNWDSPLMQQAARADWLPPVHLQFFTAGSLRACVDAANPLLHWLDSGSLSSDPAPPLLRYPLPWLRWLSRRLRGRQRHAPQLWLLLESPQK